MQSSGGQSTKKSYNAYMIQNVITGLRKRFNWGANRSQSDQEYFSAVRKSLRISETKYFLDHVLQSVKGLKSRNNISKVR